MSDSYQAIYDAVRSRISNADVGQAVRDAIGSNFDISFAREQVKDELVRAAYEMQRPSVLMRPEIDMHFGIAGGPYQAKWGPRVFGVGKSPDEAMRAFDLAWVKEHPFVASPKQEGK